jgi:hypothetical protein|tara:strand:- start:2520 stop:2630 length:111 start_codon:yes stop_codon:yes gene_type:complete
MVAEEYKNADWLGKSIAIMVAAYVILMIFGFVYAPP